MLIVRELTKARGKSFFQHETNLTAQILNDDYVAISSDQYYRNNMPMKNINVFFRKTSDSKSSTHAT